MTVTENINHNSIYQFNILITVQMHGGKLLITIKIQGANHSCTNSASHYYEQSAHCAVIVYNVAETLYDTQRALTIPMLLPQTCAAPYDLCQTFTATTISTPVYLAYLVFFLFLYRLTDVGLQQCRCISLDSRVCTFQSYHHHHHQILASTAQNAR